ncbi:MAG: S24 family peptidase [bacterium]|nr:S24 family peptidase [bacterium]
MTYYEKITARRKEMGFTQKDMAEYLEISQQGYALYEKGKRRIDFETALKIGEKLDISLDDLGLDYRPEFKRQMQLMDITPLKRKKYPLIGDIACGEPLFNERSEFFEFDDIDADFALRCRGDSMIDAHIYDGDIVLIKQCDIVDDGVIAAVAVDWDGECTLKRVFYDRENDQITLAPCNTRYKPIVIQGSDLDGVRILGRAVANISKI